jgi:SAM-dependent methyltransferase
MALWDMGERNQVTIDPELAVMVPPPEMWGWVGDPTDFVDSGYRFTGYLIDKGRVTHHSAVLDVGCGLGKHAIHFARYLMPPGRYDGFDIEPKSIAWCQKAITPRYPHMHFRHVPLASTFYAADQNEAAETFRFPYDDGSFDFVFLGSVFTHMFWAEVANYVSEIARVLKPDGRVVATAYVLGAKKRLGIEAGTAAFTFAIPYRDSWIQTMDPPEMAVAHERKRLLALFEEKGLAIEQFRYGHWAEQGIQDQDFVIARRV